MDSVDLAALDFFVGAISLVFCGWVGVREGDWFAQWEGTIKRAVSGKLQTRMPLVQPSSTPTGAALMLDGYQQRFDAL